jgi:hypothetical protein
MANLRYDITCPGIFQLLALEKRLFEEIYK